MKEGFCVNEAEVRLERGHLQTFIPYFWYKDGKDSRNYSFTTGYGNKLGWNTRILPPKEAKRIFGLNKITKVSDFQFYL